MKTCKKCLLAVSACASLLYAQFANEKYLPELRREAYQTVGEVLAQSGIVHGLNKGHLNADLNPVPIQIFVPWIQKP